jgi:hypothetical protein
VPRASDVSSFRGILGLWPDLAAIATDLSVPRETVRSWHRRDRIPLSWWGPVVESAEVRGIRGVTRSRLLHIDSNGRDNQAERHNGQ